MAGVPSHEELIALVTDLRRSEQLLREKEKKYRALAEGTNDIVYWLNAEGFLTYVGPQVRRYGMAQNDIVGKHFLDFVAPGDKTHLNHDFHRTMSTGDEFPTEMRIESNDGNVFWFEDYGKAQRDGAGKIIGVTGALRDITDRKRAEQALEASEARLQEMCRRSPFPIAIVEATGHYSYVNQKFTEVFGYTLADTPTGQAWFEKAFPNEEDRKKARRAWNSDVNLVGEKRFSPKEFKVTCKDGTVRDIVFRPVVFDNGTTLIAFEDLTEVRQAEAEREMMYKKIKKGHDDFLSVLNMLQLGIAILDREGRITFVNFTAQRLIGIKDGTLGMHWESIFRLNESDREQLEAMWEIPPEKRKPLQVQVALRPKRQYWLNVDIQDDPGDQHKRILFFYDVSEIYDLRRMLKGEARFHDIVGKSKAMQLVFRQIKDVSQVDWTVLIKGETGTGKELVARAIHFSGYRKNGPFIAVNCAGLDDPLLTSQLFGHKRGAFTGAVGDHKGFFEIADGGTILLDEIGDISENLQASLLRVLEEKKIVRLGESRPRKVNVRVLASTHRDLSEKAAQGTFRSDLLYRIRVARITLPPLRERREDIPLLVEAFLVQSRAATGKSAEKVTDDAMRALLEYAWPGNVRELKSAVEFATLHARGRAINMGDLPPEIIRFPRERPFENQFVVNERQRLLDALDRAMGNRSVAARYLGIGRSTLYRRLRKHGIKSKA